MRPLTTEQTRMLAATERSLRLKQVVERALKDDGAVLIPAFSIGRTYELLYELEEIIHRNGQRPAHTGHGRFTAKLP